MSFKTNEWKNSGELDVTRPPPHAVGPEKSVLSSMLQDPNEFIGLAIELRLTESHFYLPSHSALFGFLLEMFSLGVEIELIGLIQRLLDRGMLDGIGGPSALSDIYTYSPSPHMFASHVKMVIDKFKARELIRCSSSSITSVYDSPEDIDQALDDAEKGIMAIRESEESDNSKTIKSAIQELVTELQDTIAGKVEAHGLATGFDDIDAKIKGMKPGQLFVIAARPAMGKTAFMMNIVENVCLEARRGVIVFSLEMTRKELVKRMAYGMAKYKVGGLSSINPPNKGELQRIQRAFMEISNAETDKRLVIDDTPAMSIVALRSKARRKMREMPNTGLIAIDYLQLMTCKNKQSDGSREREVAQISAGLKSLAKELGIPIIILAQLNRGPESRAGTSKGVPKMSDLRESGAIEQDADIIGLLHRAAYYADNDEDREALLGKAQLDIAKNRSGETGNVHLTFVADLVRFEHASPYVGNHPNGDN